MAARLGRRRLLGATGGLLGLSGCLGSLAGDASPSRGVNDAADTASNAGRGDATATNSPGAAANEHADLSVLPTRERPLPLHHSLSHIRERTTSGGPGKDGIPSVDDPAFDAPDEASEWLDPGDVVFGVVRGDDVKAYPQRILVWHEVVNDVVDGDPVSVTYCPLTGTALGFERGETTFGVSGNLVNSNLVMYDRATDSRWPQIMATAVAGPFEGSSLREFPVVWTSFERWRTAYPETRVLSRRTGSVRNYNNDPYGAYNPPRGYYVNSHTLFPPLTRDGPTTYNPKRIVVGVREPDGGVVGFLKEAVRRRGVLRGRAAGTAFVAVYDPALETVYTYRDPESRRVTPADGGVVAVDGERFAPASLPLESVLRFDAMWFAWTRIYPQTVLVNASTATVADGE